MEQSAQEKTLVSTTKAAARLGICRQTLVKWAKAGAIEYVITPTKQYRFDVDGFLEKSRGTVSK